MKKKILPVPVIFSITRNKRNEFQILRDGGMLKSFESDLMDSQMILQLSVNLAYRTSAKEQISVKVFDNFSTETPCCPECGGIDVSTKSWKNFRTGSIEEISSDEEDNYCNACDKHIEL